MALSVKKNAIFVLVSVLALIGNTQHINAQGNNTDSLNLQSAKEEELDILSSSRINKGEEFEGFISYFEYGKNLYENPRGIGCNKCHGTQGQGSVIANYTHKGIDKTLSAPSIKALSYEDFSKALQNLKKSTVMPKYYLTQKEIEAIYHYVKEQENNPK